MKAIVWTRYGPPEGLELREVPRPTPKSNQVLIRVYATTVAAGDSQLRGLRVPFAMKLPLRLFLGPVRPRNLILGQELAGEIEAVGNDVTRFKVGDQIFGWTGIGLGAYAEYKCLSENAVLAPKPDNMTYAEAATLAIGGLEAAYFLKRAQIQSGQKILIYGAGGSIGTFAVQLARYYGAEVTAVDRSSKLEMLRELGATQVIDYTRSDFTRSGETYDVIFDVVGKSPFSGSLRSLAPGGRYLIDNAGPSRRVRGQWASSRSGKQVIPWADRSPGVYAEDCRFLKELVEAGRLRAVIDRTYPLERMDEAHRYVDTGAKQGNVVITVH